MSFAKRFPRAPLSAATLPFASSWTILLRSLAIHSGSSTIKVGYGSLSACHPWSSGRPLCLDTSLYLGFSQPMSSAAQALTQIALMLAPVATIQGTSCLVRHAIPNSGSVHTCLTPLGVIASRPAHVTYGCTALAAPRGCALETPTGPWVQHMPSVQCRHRGL